MQLASEEEWRLKSINSANANSIMRIKECIREYVFWEVSMSFPKYNSLIQKAVRMLGIILSVQCTRERDLCHETILEPSEHMLLFCCKQILFVEL